MVTIVYISAKVDPSFDPSKVHLSGRGLKSGKVRKPSEFLIDCRNAGAGEAPVDVKVINEDGSPMQTTDVKDNGDGTYT